MSIWDNVKKFTQPYNDDEYDEYDEDDEYMDDYEEEEEKPRRNARAGRGARRMNPFREPEREREAAPAPAQEEDDYEEAFNSIPKAAAPAPAAAAPAASSSFNGRVVNINKNDIKHQIVLFRPMSFNDTTKAGEDLKKNCVVIMNLENVEPKVARRVVDFLSGCTYALDGNVKKVAQSSYIFCPANVEISGDLENLGAEVEQYV